MRLVGYSIKTKGVSNFARRLWTVFARFGFGEARTRRALYTMLGALREVGAAPSFFIPAVVLRRHPRLLTDLAAAGAEVGVHGYVHNDYRTLSTEEQRAQTAQAVAIFRGVGLPAQGFRNPYLGWTEESLGIFADEGMRYDSNEAIFHDVLPEALVPAHLRGGLEKSLVLFQAIPPSAFALRPHFEGCLLRIPTSIPDDEMLYDRLRITDPKRLGGLWCDILRRVYDLGGVYVLNIHPERAVLTESALRKLLTYARGCAPPVWIASLAEMAAWWDEHRAFRLTVTSTGRDRWHVTTVGSARATLLTRHMQIDGDASTPWLGVDARIGAHEFDVMAPTCPCLAVSPATPVEVVDLLAEQGYPYVCAEPAEASQFATYVDEPAGLGATRADRLERGAALLSRLETLDAPLIQFGAWPNGSRAALAITGDIDSVTIQDFFLRILEVRSPTPTRDKARTVAPHEDL